VRVSARPRITSVPEKRVTKASASIAAIVARGPASPRRVSPKSAAARRHGMPSHGIDTAAATRMPVPAAESQLSR